MESKAVIPLEIMRMVSVCADCAYDVRARVSSGPTGRDRAGARGGRAGPDGTDGRTSYESYDLPTDGPDTCTRTQRISASHLTFVFWNCRERSPAARAGRTDVRTYILLARRPADELTRRTDPSVIDGTYVPTDRATYET